MRVAIVGSGIAGLTAAYRLCKQHDIVVFEANDYLGGHAATIDVELQGRQWAIDTGFIVFNDWTYPRFIALLEELDVPWQHSDMSFSVHCERTGFEYNGTSLNTLFAQRINMLRPSFWRMLADILRFNTTARRLLAAGGDSLTLAEYLERESYSQAFRERYIVPMGRAVWSATESAMLAFPLRFFVEFFDRHGFLNISHRPVWRTVKGGSREYVRKLAASLRGSIRLATPVVGIKREASHVLVRTRHGDVERFDHVILACHSDQALAMLQDPTPAELAVLGAFPYQRNEVLLHTDARLLPRRPLARAAWNYHLLAAKQDRVALTYDMNILQGLQAPEKFLVTLNQGRAVDPAKVLGAYTYHHPVYTPAAVQAQRQLAVVSGLNRTFYCGAYWGCGFHEDGVVSGEKAAADLMRLAERDDVVPRGMRRSA